MTDLDDSDIKSCRRSNKEWVCPIQGCNRILSRKQTLQNHIWSSHNIKAGNPTKKYKLYDVDEDMPVPRSTTYYKKSLGSNPTCQLPDLLTPPDTSSQVSSPDTRLNLLTPDTSLHLPPSDTSLHLPPQDTSLHLPPSDTGLYLPTADTSSLQPPDTSLHLQPPDTSLHLQPPDTSLHLQPPDTSLHLQPPDTSLHLQPPDTSLHLQPPDTSLHLPPPDTSLHLPHPDNSLHLPPAYTSFQPPDLSCTHPLLQLPLLNPPCTDPIDDMMPDFSREPELPECSLPLPLDSLQEDVDIEEESIQNFVQNYGPPLYAIPPSTQVYKSPIQQYHHYMTVCAFSSYHNLSDRGFRHLLELIGLHIPAENLLETNPDVLKKICGFNTDFLSHHLYCGTCKKLFTGDVENCKTPGCTGKKEKKTANYFVTGCMNTQLKEILQRDGMWDLLQDYTNSRTTNDTISDLLDGTEYRKLKKTGQFLAGKNNITLSFFTDGIPLFQSSKVSLWPVYLLVNELPPKQRFSRKNMVLWGIWQGCGKPEMNMFLRPLVEDLVQLYQTGFQLKENITVKAMLIVATMDLQARAYVMQMTQHNGSNGCLYCFEPGKVVKSGKGTCRMYPYSDNMSLRTKETIQRDSAESITTGKRVNGIQSKSILSCLPYFDITTNVVIDYMHGVLLGICKKLMTLWFDGKYSKEPFYIGDQVGDIDKIIGSIKPPYYLKRLPRKVAGNFHHWKASEFRSWLLYYALPCLSDILPELYLVHFSLLVEGIYTLLGEGITKNDLRRADTLLRTFVKTTDTIYGESVMGLNIHNLLHLTRCVEQWGPLWAWSCFVFESFNGEIKKTVHGTGNACRQIFWSLQCQKKVEALALSCEDDQLKRFYQSVSEGSNTRQKGEEEAYQCTIFKPTKLPQRYHFTDPVQAKLRQLCPGDLETNNFQLVKKIVRNGYVMFSKQCTRVVKRNSYTVQMLDGKVVEVDHYLLHKPTRRVYAVCQMLEPLGPVLRNRVQHLQTFKIQRMPLSVVKSESLQYPVVVIQTRSKICCGRVPNNIERD